MRNAGAASAIAATPNSEAEIHYSGLINSIFKDDTVRKFPLEGGAKLVFVYGYGLTYRRRGYYGA
ncbi:MAG TPA: hypothetical protein VGI60_05835 [Chthoniobacterales bacterium]|jgi:hypothetical protein